MSSSGVAKWQKYFSKGDVVTTTKVQTTLKLDGGGSVMLSAGTDIIMKAVSDYNPQMPATVINGPHEGKTGIVKFNDVQKPLKKMGGGGITARMKIQPADFGITNKKYKVDNFITVIYSAIEERDDLDADLKTYLQHLIGYYGEINPSVYNRKSLLDVLSNGVNASTREVEKDFGEIICAIASAKQKPYGNGDTTIFFPSAQNQSVYDFVIEDSKNGKSFVSAKSGQTTNTLSPNDVVELITRRGLYQLYKRSPEFGIIERLAEGNVVTGPIMAAAYLKVLSDEVVKLAIKNKWGRNSAEKRTLLPPEIYNECEAFVLAHGSPLTKSYLKNHPLNLAVLVAAIEYYLVTLSKKSPKYNMDNLFNAATAGEVVFWWFDGISTGSPEGRVHHASMTIGTYLRSKNNAGTKGGSPRFADKIGIQP